MMNHLEGLAWRLCAVLVAAVLGAGCTDAGRVLFVLQNQVPEEGTCLPSNDVTSQFRSRGIIDVNSSGGYLMFLLLQSGAQVNADNIDPSPNQRIITVKGADVEIEFQPGFFGDTETIPEPIASQLALTHRFTGTILPDGGTAAFVVEVISKQLLDAIPADRLDPEGRNSVKLLTKTTVFGTLDGSDVEAEPFEFPVDVCLNCLKTNIGQCSALPQSYTASAGIGCGLNQLQDVPLECCTLTSGLEQCPAAPEIATP